MEEATVGASPNYLNGAGKVMENAVESSSSITREFQDFVADVEGLVKASASLSGEALERVKDQIQKRISAAKNALSTSAQTVVRRGRRTATATHEYVTEEPWKAVGIGAALGFLAGMFISRR